MERNLSKKVEHLEYKKWATKMLMDLLPLTPNIIAWASQDQKEVVAN